MDTQGITLIVIFSTAGIVFLAAWILEFRRDQKITGYFEKKNPLSDSLDVSEPVLFVIREVLVLAETTDLVKNWTDRKWNESVVVPVKSMTSEAVYCHYQWGFSISKDADQGWITEGPDTDGQAIFTTKHERMVLAMLGRWIESKSLKMEKEEDKKAPHDARSKVLSQIQKENLDFHR